MRRGTRSSQESFAVQELQHNEDFYALSTLVESLQRVAALELRTTPDQTAATVDLKSVLDEFRVLIENAYRESEIQIVWQVAQPLPLVWADRYGLIQVFLNLAKNSQRAMRSTETKRLCVTASEETCRVVIRFEDTGVGIASPENLFRPFQRGPESGGLGLFVSRAIMKSFGGELAYEAMPPGCCFVISVAALCANRRNRPCFSILILDDHALFRESLVRLLHAERGFEVVAHCG